MSHEQNPFAHSCHALLGAQRRKCLSLASSRVGRAPHFPAKHNNRPSVSAI